MSDGELVTLPSGNVVLARRIDPQTVFTEEDHVVPLLIELDHCYEALMTTYEIIDRAVPLIVIEPTIEPSPSLPAERSDICLYVDDIDIEDKAYLWQWAVGQLQEAP